MRNRPEGTSARLALQQAGAGRIPLPIPAEGLAQADAPEM